LAFFSLSALIINLCLNVPASPAGFGDLRIPQKERLMARSFCLYVGIAG